MKESILYKKLEGNKVKCLTCNHYCQIADGKSGTCNVRRNKSGKLEVLNYGKFASVAIDPIEKKPFYHFLPGSSSLSTSMPGCNFKCGFCQNWQISQIGDNSFLEKKMDGEDILPKNIVNSCLENNCKSIAYTYTEPTVFVEFAHETMELAKKKNIFNLWVSNGFMSKEARDLILPCLDGINIDLKSFNEDFYHKVCKARLQPVLENIEFFAKQDDVHLELTTLIIPGENDSKEELKSIAEFIAKLDKAIPWHLSAFAPEVSHKMHDKSRTPAAKLKEAYEIGKRAELKFVYARDFETEGLEDTYCPKCGEKLIERNWAFDAQIIGLKEGKCQKCGRKIEVKF